MKFTNEELGPTPTAELSERLYLILVGMRDGLKSARSAAAHGVFRDANEGVAARRKVWAEAYGAWKQREVTDGVRLELGAAATRFGLQYEDLSDYPPTPQRALQDEYDMADYRERIDAAVAAKTSPNDVVIGVSYIRRDLNPNGGLTR